MFTLAQIDDIHQRLGKQHTLPQYLQALNAIGVVKCESFLADGHTEYFGTDSQKLVSPPVHQRLRIAGKSSREDLLIHLDLHQQGKTSYLEMSQGLASAGVEKWTFDTGKMIISWYDKAGNELLGEAVG